MKKNKEILDELNDISPLLFSLKESEESIDISEINFEPIQQKIFCVIKKTTEDIFLIRKRSIFFIKGGIVASLLLAFLLIALIFKNETNSTENLLSKHQKEAQESIGININELSAKDIGYLFAKQVKIEDKSKEFTKTSGLSEMEINQYIENNPVYISDLFENDL